MIPYEINREDYDKTIEMLRTAINNTKIGEKDRLMAIAKLKGMYAEN